MKDTNDLDGSTCAPEQDPVIPKYSLTNLTRDHSTKDWPLPEFFNLGVEPGDDRSR